MFPHGHAEGLWEMIWRTGSMLCGKWALEAYPIKNPIHVRFVSPRCLIFAFLVLQLS